MHIENYSEQELRQLILTKLKENELIKMNGLTATEMADHFLEYTPMARQIIIDYYAELEMTKTAFHHVFKVGFEREYFYIAATDTVVTLALLGFQVNCVQEANVSKRSMDKLLKRARELGANERGNFFRKNNLRSRQINSTWETDWY